MAHTIEQRVNKMKENGYQFALCWNFNKDCKRVFNKAKRFNVEKVTNIVRAIRINESFGKNIALVILHKEATYNKSGQTIPTSSAIEVLNHLGLLPMKSKIDGDFFNQELVSFQWADTNDVLAFF